MKKISINNLGIESEKDTLRARVKKYTKKFSDLKVYLDNKPTEWSKYQDVFNKEIDYVFSEILEFERDNVKCKDYGKIQKLKDFFVKNFKYEFYYGQYSKHSIDKPYGYSGDFQIIDWIYQNKPSSTGYDRLFDNYFMASAISKAVRNRKEDFKRIIAENICNKSKPVRVMNLASGPAREIKEIFDEIDFFAKDIFFDCYDTEKDAHDYAKQLMKDRDNVNYFLENALRIAGSRNINERIYAKYDVIYSMGLFDYLNYKISVRLIQNLRKLLKKDGVLIVADVRNKYLNPSVFYMEWAGDWNLIYRNDQEFKQIFIDSGFKVVDLEQRFEEQGIIQYIIARA